MKKSLIALGLLALVLLVSAIAKSEAQPADNPIAQRLSAIEDGKLHIVFEAREGVWGDGKSVMTFSDGQRWHESWDSRRRLDPGPVRVLFTLRDGEITHLKTRVGGRSHLNENIEDMGEVDSREAADVLLWLAETARPDVAVDAIGAAVLAADAEIWPRLLPLARDRKRSNDLREAAIFWLGQEAGEKMSAELQSFVDDDEEDLEIREHAIFALSQRPDEESVPALIRIARTIDHPELRKNAFFWLAQHDDERVVDLFEEILTN